MNSSGSPVAAAAAAAAAAARECLDRVRAGRSGPGSSVCPLASVSGVAFQVRTGPGIGCGIAVGSCTVQLGPVQPPAVQVPPRQVLNWIGCRSSSSSTSAEANHSEEARAGVVDVFGGSIASRICSTVASAGSVLRIVSVRPSPFGVRMITRSASGFAGVSPL